MRIAQLLVLTTLAFGLISAVVQAEEPRDIRRIELAGNASIPASEILECLSRYPAVLAAAERTNSETDFARVIEETIRDGYKQAGFSQCRVQVSSAGDRWKASIVEGSRTLNGPIRIQGDPDTAEWLQKSLESYQATSDKFIWIEGKPWNGQLTLLAEQQTHLNEFLTGLGINPRFVSRIVQHENASQASSGSVALILNVPTSIKPTRLETIKCEEADRELIASTLAEHGIEFGSSVDSDTPARAQRILLDSTAFDIVATKLDVGHGLGDMALAVLASRSPAASENAVMARQKLLSFTEKLKQLISGNQGLHLTMSLAEAEGHAWVFEKSFAIEIDKESKEVARFINNADTDKAAIQTGEATRYAFGIPNLVFRFGVSTDDLAKKKISCQFGADFASNVQKAKAKENRFDLDLVTACVLFPLNETRFTETPDGCVIKSPRGELRLKANGDFKSLSVESDTDPDAGWLVESVDRLPDNLRAMEVSDKEQLAFTIPADDPQQ